MSRWQSNYIQKVIGRIRTPVWRSALIANTEVANAGNRCPPSSSPVTSFDGKSDRISSRNAVAGNNQTEPGTIDSQNVFYAESYGQEFFDKSHRRAQHCRTDICRQ